MAGTWSWRETIPTGAIQALAPALGPTEYPAPVTALRNELDRSGQHKIDGIMARDAVNRGILVGVTFELPPDIYDTLDNVDRYVLS